ncbi:hypothetical protein [Mycobacteroides abscessus]|uniref:hypothetical protein n=1 Tax=Mycobacteroides abscessus TaxID=36809 RepID=UPI001877F401|nr:hypothetical protein [Mycobacteroides abscessus]
MTTNENLVTAAKAVVAAHLSALGPLAEIASHTVDSPPALDAALTAVLHLHAAAPQLDAAVTDLFRGLLAAGVTEAKLTRLLGMRAGTRERPSTLTARLAARAPASVAVPEIEPGVFTLRDRISVRAARESLISAAFGVGDAYLDALRPISRLSGGGVPDAAVVDVALEAVVHLHRSRKQLTAALDPVLAALVLGGVKRMGLAQALGCHASVLQRRLAAQPLAHARWVDLEEAGDGTWRVEPAAVGRYAPKTVADLEAGFDLEAAIADAVGA